MRLEEGRDFDAAILGKILTWLMESDGVLSNRERRVEAKEKALS